ncbi:hypothetical protein SLEP1_g20724 [Rubroshorea leprosula]|uniref:Plastocyanin-like domain-containing protein n=1 Tax=Rubroshorea leprosula TaxID=152421 RepID=A0AAV5J3K9_9ROSI|nr:hypothetical protein SLEP1_g20724 [Rubroshorea leprosula]
MQYTASLSNISWVDPATDVLQAYYRNMSGFYTTDFPNESAYFFNFQLEDAPGSLALAQKATKVKVSEYDEEVEIVFQSTKVMNSSQDHPMHLHGYNFYVIGQGTGDYDFEYYPKDFNLVDPPYLNTVSVPKFRWVAIRFKANNSGVWLWHCHLDHHYSLGMNVVIIVKNGNTLETSMREPPPYMPHCDDSSRIRLWRNYDTKALESEI